MASRIELPFWPTTLDCLSWSEDNIIAIAGGEQIGILTPRLHGPGPNGSLWDSTLFKANAFTAAEVPRLEPLTSSNWSAGEELSLRHVHSLQWSPPGLGRFRHCVIAVLTSNHVLSIWECNGKSTVSGDWKRTAIVNHALKAQYAKSMDNSGESAGQNSEWIQVSQRIRAFAWCPDNGSSSSLDTDGRGSVDTQEELHHLLAVSSEAGDISILRLRSPHGIMEPTRKEWQIEVVQSVNLVDHLPSMIDRDDLAFNDAEPERECLVADHLTWQSISIAESNLRPTLTLITEGCLFALDFRTQFGGQASFENETRSKITVSRLLSSRSDFTGPLRYEARSGMLTVFAPNTVYEVHTPSSTNGAAIVDKYHLNGRWDEVSGAAFTHYSSSAIKIHIASHLSSSTSATTTLTIPMSNDEVSVPPKWQSAIVEAKHDFSAKYNLDNHVQARTWGLASSPLGDQVATAINLLPSDSVAHIIPSDQRTIVNITREVPFEDANGKLAIQNSRYAYATTSEVLSFYLQRYCEHSQATPEIDYLVQAILPLSRSQDPTVALDGERYAAFDADPQKVVSILRHLVLAHPEAVLERSKTIVSIALGDQSSIRPKSLQIIKRLVHQVVDLFSSYSFQDDELSRSIRDIYRVIHSKLLSPLEANDIDTGDDSLIETCRVCTSSIKFESIKWARCASGHQFSRCALTFLAIQSPGTSKHCGVCGVQVLNEYKLPGLASPADGDVVMANGVEHDVTGDGEQAADAGEGANGYLQMPGSKHSRSLARVLFAAFDTCIYCGGKCHA